MRISIPGILICEHCGNSDFMGQTAANRTNCSCSRVDGTTDGRWTMEVPKLVRPSVVSAAADCHVACFLCVIGIYCRSVGWRKGHVKWTSQRGAPGRAAFEPDIIDIGIQSGFSINLQNRKTKRPMQWQQQTVDQNPFCQAPRRPAAAQVEMS